MNFLYKFPMFLFLPLQNCLMSIYFSKFFYKNHFLVYINPKWIHTLQNIVSRDLFFSKNYLIESFLVDTSEFSINLNFPQTKQTNKKYLVTEYITIHSIFSKVKLTILTNHLENKFIQSNEHFFKNLNWLERENSEMFGVLYNFKSDSRRLLLDYSKDESPMLKNFPCSGLQECYYDIFENQISYLDIVNIEL